MKLITGQKNLKKSLGIVEKIVSRNPSLPILNNVLLKTENGRLKLSATNLEIGISVLVGAKIEEVGEIAVPARIFSDFISNLHDERVSLATKGNILSINSDNYKTQILGFDTKNFPIIPKVKNDSVCSIPSLALKTSLMSIFDSMAVSEVRPELAGVYVGLNENTITFASTDGFRLTEKILNCKPNKKVEFILPRNTVAELIRIAGDMETDLEIFIKDNQIGFSGNDFELVSRIVDGTFPDYRRIIPEKYISKVLITKEEFEKKVKLAGLFSSSISDIKISCIKDKINITSKNSDKGEIEVSIESLLKNEPFDISLNFHYLLDGLKAIGNDKAVIEFTGAGSPLVMRPANSEERLVYLIMPFRS